MFQFDHRLPEMVLKTADRAADRMAQNPPNRLWDLLGQVNLCAVRERIAGMSKPERLHLAVPVKGGLTESYSTAFDTLPMIGVDGSQIYPVDDLYELSWGYIQSVACQSLQVALFESEFLEFGSVMSGRYQQGSLMTRIRRNGGSLMRVVDELRNLQERMLALQASEKFPDALVVMDGPIIPPGEQKVEEQGDFHSDSSSWLPKLQGQKIIGLVSAPKSRYLYSLITACQEKTDKESWEGIGIPDFMILEHGLSVGYRSSIFLPITPINQQQNCDRDKIFCFYIRLGQTEVVRIDLPGWMLGEDDLIEQIHATILADAIIEDYSLVLTAAHNAVSIPMAIAIDLQTKFIVRFWEHSGRLPRSAKTVMKSRR